MARTTGPILAIGVITYANQDLLHHNLPEGPWRLALGTGLAALVFTGIEAAAPAVAVALAWVALATSLLLPVRGVPAPLTTLGTMFGAPKGKVA